MNRQSPVGMMLQFAFGPGSTNGKSLRGPAANADGGEGCEASPQLLALAAAAKAWWEAGRPEGWSLEQHLASPTAGCDGSEAQRVLAQTVAHWLGQEH